MDCPECVGLIAEHTRLKAAYAVACQEFRTGSVFLPIDAWFDAERALLEFERHKRSHIQAD
jgi:hypothetical protein